jgi:hypothetical protein
MSKNGLHRHYDRLDAQERFRLDVLAMAREDSLESERLVSSCPRATYVMNDIGFVERWRSAIEITLRVYIPLGEQLAKLQMVDALRVFAPYSQTLLSNVTLDAYFKGHEAGSRHAWAYAGKTGAPPAWPDDGPEGELVEPDGDERDPVMERDLDELEVVAEQYNRFFPEVLDELERRCARQAFSIWTGYEAFCEESVGVSAENLAAVVLEPVVEAVEEARTRAERLGVETDAELVDQMLETLTEAWDTVQARGTRRRA